jgi:flavin reductase (DIM6/NTAB) family NADH-FMN oxidoreductase RutF
MKSLLKLVNYSIFSVTTYANQKINANIVCWAMQTAMKSKYLTIALDKNDYTIELVKESGILNLNLLSVKQSKLIAKLGRKSGRSTNKFFRLNYLLDERGCPILLDSVGYLQCEVHDNADSGDHEVFVCKVLKQKFLNPEAEPLSMNYLREKKLIRG